MNAETKTIADELFEAACECLAAERERQAKLKYGSPASTYTERRISRIEAALERYRQEQSA